MVPRTDVFKSLSFLHLFNDKLSAQSSNVAFRDSMSGQMKREDVLRQKLEMLRVEHRDLDDAIAAMAAQPVMDRLAHSRLKKRKLALKDQITRIEDEITPDIIA